MTDPTKQLHIQLAETIKLVDKLSRQKSYLIDLLIKDPSPSTTAIINKYLDWLEEDEVIK
jgi:hypothetical protein